MKRIVVISDCSDVAYHEVRASILSYLDKKGILDVCIEPLVSVKEFSILNASFLIRLMAECYPPENTIFLVIVNALNTTTKDRARIMGETKNGFKFVGANTGALNWLIEDFGLKCLYEFDKKNLSGKDFVGFGGKYFHAPMAAKIASGEKMEDLGMKREENFLASFKIQDGVVIHIDNFNVYKIKGNIPSGLKEDDEVIVKFNQDKINCKFTYSMKDLPDNAWAIYRGSSLNGLPEIGRVRSLEGLNKYGVKIGDILKFSKDEK